MSRRRDVSGITRKNKVEIQVDDDLLQDLSDIAEAWKVPRATACYWLLRGLVADARGDKLIVAGNDPSERLAKWLVRKFPQEIGSDVKK